MKLEFDAGMHVFRLWTLIDKRGSFRLAADVDTLPELKRATDQHRGDSYAFVLSWRIPGEPKFLWGTFNGQVHTGDTRGYVSNLLRSLK